MERASGWTIPRINMLRVLQLNCARRTDITTAVLQDAWEVADILLLQEPGWNVRARRGVKDRNFEMIYGEDIDGRRPRVLTCLRKAVVKNWSLVETGDEDCVVVDIEGMEE